MVVLIVSYSKVVSVLYFFAVNNQPSAFVYKELNKLCEQVFHFNTGYINFYLGILKNIMITICVSITAWQIMELLELLLECNI